MIEKPLAEGWRLMAYAEPVEATWPPYIENEERSMRAALDSEGCVDLDFDTHRGGVYIPRQAIEALFKAVDEWKAAQSTPATASTEKP